MRSRIHLGGGAMAKAGGFNATVIDAVKGVVVATIHLGDKPETGQADPSVGRVFVNLENKSLVGYGDRSRAKRLFVCGDKAVSMIDYTTG